MHHAEMRTVLITAIFYLTTFTQSSCQQNTIILKNRINYEDLSFFDELAEVTDKKAKFKTEFKYLNNLEFDSIVYNSDGKKIFGFIIRPLNGHVKLPCIIFNRGGNRDFGSLTPALMIYMLSKLASNGFVVIASNYRGNSKSEGQDEFGGSDVADVLTLIDALSEIPQADTSRIGMYGWSRGGLMTYIALSKTSRIKTAVIGGSPTDMFLLANERPGFEQKVLMKLIPNYNTSRTEELVKRSPIFWVKDLPKIPLFIVHGDKDDRVSANHALAISKLLTENKSPHRLIIFEGSNHTIKEHREELDQMIIDWFTCNS